MSRVSTGASSPGLFFEVRILKGLQGGDFVSADCKGVKGGFLGSAYCKGVGGPDWGSGSSGAGGVNRRLTMVRVPCPVGRVARSVGGKAGSERRGRQSTVESRKGKDSAAKELTIVKVAGQPREENLE